MRIASFATVAAIAFASAVVVAKPLTQAQALAVMHERHEGMETIGNANKSLRRQIESSSPDAMAVRLSAAQIAQLSRKASGWFPAGTGPELGKTGAKPEIWQKPQDFAAKLHNFQVAAQVFQAAANSGDAAALKGRYSDMIHTCSACHDDYRMDMHH
jgi:cytochrome c556